MFHYFLAWRGATASAILNGKPVPLAGRLLYGLGNILVYAPLQEPLGFSRVRVAYTAGEAIGPELFRFYRSLGINLKQLYGQTEASVYITAQPDGEVYSDTVGKPGPNVEIKIADNGEVLFKSPGVFLKYLQERRQDRRGQDAGRLGAHRRRRLLRPATGTSRSSIAPRTSAGSTTARCSRRSTSRTSSSSIPRSARRWPSATGPRLRRRC